MREKNRIGIVQGRLTKAPPNCLQWFPENCWENEFSLARALGLDYIELLAESDHNHKNPIWDSAGLSSIREACHKNGLLLYSICNDFVMKHSLLSDPHALEQSAHLLHQAGLLGIEIYVLPLFEASGIEISNCDRFRAPILEISRLASEKGITVCLETLLKAKELADFLNSLGCKNVKCVFDTGNRAVFGGDLDSEIRTLGDQIGHVHIKDKNADNQNVYLGTGLVNFFKVFRALSNIHYQGAFTFESVRGKDPLRTANYNKMFLHYFRQEGSHSP